LFVIVLLMGVQGSGKTTVGQALAARLQWDFADADDFHSAANKAKMAAGIALNDEDRAPWLSAIRAAMEQANHEGRSLVVGCSALKEKYREQLVLAGVRVVYLHGSQALIASRLQARHGHYAKLNLLPSQFAALEEPRDAMVVEIDQPVEAIVDEVVAKLGP
jgi:gluconokinase